MIKQALMISTLLMVGGCASTSMPTNMASTAAAIRSAEEMGANENPRAALHLQLAQEQSDRAKAIMEAGGDKEEASMLLARSEADAELALALARQESTRTEAKAAMERVKVLKQSN